MSGVSGRKLDNILNKVSLENRTPITGLFELTPLCNLACKMCFVHVQSPGVKDRVLSGEQWIALMKESVAAGLLRAVLTGGEAMMHPDFWEIYMYLASQGVRTVVKTNGILLDGEAVRKFTEYPPVSVDVSLYGSSGEAYAALTGRDVFETVTENIRRAIEAGLRVQISITPSRYMLPWVEETMDLAKSFGTGVIVNDVLLEARDTTGRKLDGYNLSLDEYAEIDRLRREKFPAETKAAPEKDVPPERGSGTGDQAGAREKRLACSAGRNSFAINWDGIMVPCLAFPREIAAAKPFETGFEAAWKSVNGSVERYEIPDACLTCRHFEKCKYCPPQHGAVSAQRQCNPDVCGYWDLYFRAREGTGK